MSDATTENVVTMPLADARADMADMATCIIIGNAHTRIIERDERPALLYTPRSVPAHG